MRKNIFSLIVLLFLCLFSSSIYAQTDISNATATVEPSSFEYDGNPKEPKVNTFFIPTKTGRRPIYPVEGTDYDLSYENNIHVGTAKVIVTSKGTKYKGTASFEFEITALDLSKKVTLELEKYKFDYDGNAKEPAPLDLYYGETKLINGTDYDITYKNNINPGDATATATFKGDYTGSVSTKFNILDSGTVPPSSLMVNYYDGSMANPKVEREMTYSEFLTLLGNFPNAIAIAPQGFDKWPLDKKHIVVEGKNELNNICNSFTLTDKEDFYTSVSFTASTFSYTRNLVEGYNTVCLPVGIGEVDIPEGAGIYQYFGTNEEENQIYFIKFQEMSAGYPWLMKTQEACEWKVDLSNARIEKNAIEDAYSTVGGLKYEGFMSGTYTLTSKYKYDENHPYYGLRNHDNKFAPLANTLSPFRACISIHDINVSEAKAFRISTFDSITEIENVKAQNKKVLSNGKFVKEGQIVIVKNGKTYNISGAEIK